MPGCNFGDELWALSSGIHLEKNYNSGVEIPAREMAKFKMFIESPIDAAERAVFLLTTSQQLFGKLGLSLLPNRSAWLDR